MINNILPFCIILGGLSVCSAFLFTPKPDELPKAPAPHLAKPKPQPPALITAELSRAHAQPGDLVRLTELVPVNREIRVRSVEHTVHVIGQYDLATNNLVNRDPEKPLYWGGDLLFDDWHGNTMVLCDKPFLFDVTNPREEGLEFEFKARQLGIYLIRAKWTLYRSKDVIESNPVILTVKPPLGKDGKPIIKEEWIDPIHWKHRPR